MGGGGCLPAYVFLCWRLHLRFCASIYLSCILLFCIFVYLCLCLYLRYLLVYLFVCMFLVLFVILLCLLPVLVFVTVHVVHALRSEWPFICVFLVSLLMLCELPCIHTCRAFTHAAFVTLGLLC